MIATTRIHLIGIAVCLAGSGAVAQPPVAVNPLLFDDFPRSTGVHEQRIYLDSGWVGGNGSGHAPVLVYSGVVQIEDSMWVRLHFGQAVLSGERGDVNASCLVLTSLLDGATQMLWAEDLEAWSMSGAYFNGSAVRVELFVSPDSGPSRVRVDEVEWGVPGWLDRSLCGVEDDRNPSNDPATGRLLPSQCTAWLVDDLPGGFLTAGHCSVGARSVVEFNVPASTIGGSMVHPDPSDQYPVDPSSVQKQVGASNVGNDWLFFGSFENTTTGYSPAAIQRATHHLADSTPPNDGRSVSVTGYGQVSQPMPLQYNFIQLTQSGPFHGGGATVARYSVDTTGGDSGAPVIDDATGLAIAIHTNGGCNSNGWNRGTATTHPDLRSALANPVGAARAREPVKITFPQGRPEVVDSNGQALIRIRINASPTREPILATATLHVLDGDQWQEVGFSLVHDDVLIARFPELTQCSPERRYFVSVENSLGEIDTAPAGAPAFSYSARSDTPAFIAGAFNFDESVPWITTNASNLETGEWTVGTPPEIGRLGPRKDFDDNGYCLLTGSANREDVDNGWTTATSPAIRTHSGSDTWISMALWHASTSPGDDGLAVEVSTDLGASWVEIDRVLRTDGWEMRVYRVSDFAPVTGQLLIRYTVSDPDMPGIVPEGGIVEAAVDAIVVFEPDWLPE